VEQLQVGLQHALSVSNSELRQARLEREEAIDLSKEMHLKLNRAEREKNYFKELADQLQLSVEHLNKEVSEVKEELAETQEQAGLYYNQYVKVCGVLKEKVATEIDPLSLWVVQLDEIEITDIELGRGSWGAVHKANFRGLSVAAKRMHHHIISDYNRELFEREMSIASRIHHPNVVQFIGATREKELIILTEMMATNVWSELQARPLKQFDVTSISLQVAKALNYLHLMKPDPILHRDVSSSNVLLNPGPQETWRAKLSDYGSANYALSAVTQGPGNAAYSAPDREQTTKMDVYSFGVLLLEMCIRRMPNNRATDDEREQAIKAVSCSCCQNIIQLCAEKKPTHRPNMSDIIKNLEIALFELHQAQK